jgi:hypothetical protein
MYEQPSKISKKAVVISIIIGLFILPASLVNGSSLNRSYLQVEQEKQIGNQFIINPSFVSDAVPQFVDQRHFDLNLDPIVFTEEDIIDIWDGYETDDDLPDLYQNPPGYTGIGLFSVLWPSGIWHATDYSDPENSEQLTGVRLFPLIRFPLLDIDCNLLCVGTITVHFDPGYEVDLYFEEPFIEIFWGQWNPWEHPFPIYLYGGLFGLPIYDLWRDFDPTHDVGITWIEVDFDYIENGNQIFHYHRIFYDDMSETEFIE